MDPPPKPIHTLILDTGPLIKNDPPISTLLSKSVVLLTLPSILLEIRDPATRSRVDTTLKPFLQLRDPKPESLKIIQEFARRSGDLQVLSRPDVAVLALAYEVECERNGGDWRLRKVPGQVGINGQPPEERKEVESGEKGEGDGGGKEEGEQVQESDCESTKTTQTELSRQEEVLPDSDAHPEKPEDDNAENSMAAGIEKLDIMDDTEQPTKTAEALNSNPASASQPTPPEHPPAEPTTDATDPDLDSSDSDSEGWITPSNFSKHLASSSASPTTTTSKHLPQKTLQVATLTSDFAMQNVLLLMNLNLLSPSLTRISHLKTHILRCHACFLQVKDLSKQFCPRCGQPALTRVSCSTDARTGEFKLHLKKNMQWNTRGDRYSIPKPVHGSANGKREVGTGGGKGGWGKELILSEDQKEYVRKVGEGRREKARDLMDEDYLPGILTGERASGHGRVRVGAGRNVNSRKR